MAADDSTRTRIGVGDVKAKPVPELVGKTVLERYRVEAELGKGAMGTVYRGTHHRLARSVAIKVLHEHLMHDTKILARFQREAQVAARLQHPNLISVLDVGETEDGLHIMVLELAKGPSLADVMGKKPLTAERTMHLVRQLLAGLDHAHGEGLIHRDLKPANVMVETSDSGEEVARIVDFGIAVLRDPDESIAGGKLTSTGQILGTPLYMAPEQAKGDAFDHRVDLFALGVIVYEMLSGKWPFEGSAIEIAIANIGQDPPPIAKRAPGVTADPLLERFARKLMARRLTDRFGSAHEALHVLDLIVEDRPEAALAMGIMNVKRALDVVSLPPPPKL
jgi:eukaryotic-like serine/threonine-protein kinase